MGKYWILYNYVQSIGANTHKIEIYNTYSEEQGLEGHVITIEHTTAREVLDEVGSYTTSTEQWEMVKNFYEI